MKPQNMSGASALPDELWSRILELGIECSNFNYKDLCCLSMTCPRLNQLSSEDSLWSSLLSADFPQYSYAASYSSLPKKLLYKKRYEKVRNKKLMAHRRAVSRIQSEINEHTRRLRELERRSVEEKEKMKNTVAELLNLQKTRQASVALNVWQPEVVRAKQKQIVEQCDVPIDNRIHALEMELKLCRHQVEWIDKSLRIERRRIQIANRKLASVEYHPLRDFNLAVSPINEHAMRRQRFRTSSTYPQIPNFLGSTKKVN